MTVDSSPQIKIVVLGARKVGKSAVTVRYLTRRFIGEYSSSKDLLYRHHVCIDDQSCEVEVFDTSRFQDDVFPANKVDWADAFVVVYSTADRQSFHMAAESLRQIQELMVGRHASVILLGNKKDLEHVRQVGIDDGHEMSLHFQCQFYEVSAADTHVGVTLAFQSALRETLEFKSRRTLPIRQKLGAMTVSKMIGAVFGKAIKNDKKKRPSLSL
ncbi:ras-related and estrogen-regulated growth inhibitor-like protein isoform X1 [Tachypleus tridentatus]|uniref:ras-related and estrogen-regulated growth inhibitor-like protein isoform X1 n=1 Tax=Tachypleus tridentatus TaxID=6853 RepID=UPI003FD4398E